jgi:CDP-diacylglycerol--glycerol-3-phosphate 3-phosphatidyltransferase
VKKADWRKRSEVLGLSPAELIAQRRRVFTVSNGVSLSRVVVLPFLIYAISLPPEQGIPWVIGLSSFAALTDLLDGLIARRLHQVSDMGKVIDPVADKLCIGAAAVALTIYRDLPTWIPALVIGRDVLIVAGGIVLARRADVVLPSNAAGRLTTDVLTLTLFSYAIGWSAPQRPLVWASGALVPVSLVLYLRIGWHILRKLRPR